MTATLHPGQMLMLAFKGMQSPSDEFLHTLRDLKPAGITLFRSFNIENPAQLRALTASLQRSASQLGLPPLLIALDQEGGQLMAVGSATQLPGNMALGAAGSEELAYQAGQVLGSELASMGVNVDYAPCADVNTNPANPVVGVRSFGEDPDLVARLSAAVVRGIQSQGVAATAKHFPGHGDTSSDSHLGLALNHHSIEEMRRIDLPPFKAAIDAGVKLVMSAHLGAPDLDPENILPATLSSRVLQGMLRDELGFNGLIISDAMDMRAIRQGELLVEDAARAIAAGCDLLLGTSDPQDHRRLFEGVKRAIEEHRISPKRLEASMLRVQKLKQWLDEKSEQPPLSVVNSPEHQPIADRIAERSITLVRNDRGLIPLKLEPGQRIAVILPKPQDLTPADTSSYLTPQLANAVRAHHANTTEIIVPLNPATSEINAILGSLADADLVIVGTINASSQPGQAEMVNRILATGKPVVTAALRLPYDLAVYPGSSTYLCTYSILEPSIRALANVLFGVNQPSGKLPVTIPGMAVIGSGL